MDDNRLYPEHTLLETSIVATAKEFAANEGIELTRYYEYIGSHYCHAFNGVMKTDRVCHGSAGKWVGVRVTVFLDENGIISAEIPNSRSKPFGHATKEEAKY